MCECPTCKAYRAKLPAGPYDPQQYALIAPPTVGPGNGEPHVGDDPRVQAAEEARDVARVAFDLLDAEWVAAVSASTSAALLANDPYTRDAGGDITGRRADVKPGHVRELEAAEQDLRERRDAAWAKVVKANDRIVAAQARARARIVEAARGGTSRRGR